MVKDYVRVNFEAVCMANGDHAEKVVLRAKPRGDATLLVFLAEIVIVVRFVAHILGDAITFTRRWSPDTVEAKFGDGWGKLGEVGIPA